MLNRIKKFRKAKREYYAWLDVWCDCKTEVESQLDLVTESDDTQSLFYLRTLIRYEHYAWNKLLEAEKNYKWWKK